MSIINDSDDQKKPNQFSDEIISPMFGYDYKNRIVSSKNKNDKNAATTKKINSLEKQIEEELEEQNKIIKAKEYQETLKTDTNVLKEYHKQKENQNLKDALPSNYLNFRDSLEKISDDSIISVFDSTTSISDSTISEFIEDVLNEESD
ncbi:MAG: hypothetical protein ACRC8P_00255 [Spiroplasma sp.]